MINWSGLAGRLPSLWNVAYPTGLLPTIKLQGAKGVDPYLIAAIIREESQYDVEGGFASRRHRLNAGHAGHG